MPYIKQSERRLIDHKAINILASDINVGASGSAGRANYILTSMLHEAYDLRNTPSYSKINEIIGILECVKSELYRRVAAKYEDQKIIDNKDVGEFDCECPVEDEKIMRGAKPTDKFSDCNCGYCTGIDK